MKRAKRWLFTTATVLLLCVLASTDAALPFKKVSIAKASASTTSTTSTTTTAAPDYDTDKEEEVPAEAPSESEDNKSDNATLSKNSKLTGIPQIDYIWDPNLPRELRGYNLSTYPFLSTVPPMDEIHFKCEGLHDGFYASIEYKCQIYHHCVYGIRHDFLCANFTAFDQRTFICHFASDVDCEGSQKYWNRNDELYMATTTTSTSTSTTEAPATAPPRRRPTRPYQRRHRRPLPDYYEEDDYYYNDYDDEVPRNKQRPRSRPRKPQPDYDDEYVEKQPARRNRNRYRDEEYDSDDDYDDRRKRPGRRKAIAAAAGGTGKGTPRKPGRVDERRSFNEDRTADEPRRASAGRRRANEKRTTPSTADLIDDLEEIEKPYGLDQEEAAEEQTPQKVKTTPKPLAEYITPKSAASVYSRPRAPPRIARPVPINEKKKYSYPVQKNAAANAAGDADEEDYYQEPEQEAQEEPQHEDDYVEPQRTTPRRRTVALPREQKQHPTRPTLRKPVTDKKQLLSQDDQDYYANDAPRRKRPQGNSRSRGTPAPAPTAADADFVDDVDYEEKPLPARNQRLRPKTAVAPAPAARKPIQRPRQPIVQPEEPEAELEPNSEEQEPAPPPRPRVNAANNARRNQKLAQATRQRALPTVKTTAASIVNDEVEQEPEPELDEPELDETEEPLAPAAPAKSQRPASVRVVKRPFLPSRGGSPYLPRGLQPVGVAVRQQQQLSGNNDAALHRTTESTPIDMGSTISGVRLLEHGAPLLRGEEAPPPPHPPSTHAPRTTLPPRSALPTAVTPRRPEPLPAKLNLDELYENDYDVTLNDALDPTLKPLTPQHSQPHQHQPQHASYQGRPYASAYAAPASESGAYNPFNSYQQPQQTSIYQNHSPSSASALQSPSQPQHQPQHQHQSQSQSQPASSYHSDSYFSSTDIRRRAIATAPASRSHRHEYAAAGGAVTHSQLAARPQQQFYDDFAY
ncbi:LOW QUALITY PROTEIN: serine/arginine repetitive matrix protein 1 [Drosophila nasuta]|uniref:LOW QUALITY PROTEIN: serine/arginine repetitive matrix protein 1 n=1 Tax=Drosophila nasuta TaxID=42062 RepID=UPI00295ECED8|nr:LOW QUALITY PROTEIN: serine/arginine repetitive matrix protein 1 [Drosophila nasuta]